MSAQATLTSENRQLIPGTVLIEVRGGPRKSDGKSLGRGKHRGSLIVAYAIVDQAYAEVVGQYAWSMGGHKKNYAATHIDGLTVLLHRFVFKLHYGRLPDGDKEVDHIDRDRLNCTIQNLREVPPDFNNANGERKVGISGYRGVRFRYGGWVAQVSQNNKTQHLGVFPTANDAARAVNAAYRVRFPGIAVPNPSVED